MDLKSAGDIERARKLPGGGLLIKCKNKEQVGKTKMLGKLKVSGQLPNYLTETREVVYLSKWLKRK